MPPLCPPAKVSREKRIIRVFYVIYDEPIQNLILYKYMSTYCLLTLDRAVERKFSFSLLWHYYSLRASATTITPSVLKPDSTPSIRLFQDLPRGLFVCIFRSVTVLGVSLLFFLIIRPGY